LFGRNGGQKRLTALVVKRETPEKTTAGKIKK
jgi:hypothetical protein